VTLLLASNEGQAAAAAGAVEAAGGKIAYRDDELGYIRVDLPIAQAEAVETIDSIQAAEVDELVPLPDPSPDASKPAQPQPPPGPATPNDNPYMPIGEIGASAFMAAHPTWDGRGVTIGIVDTGVDLHHPSLQTTSTGERKIVDWVTGTHPSTDNDPTWVNVSTGVFARNGTFTVGPDTYTAPANRGSFFFGVFNERDPRLGGISEIGNDVNRDGNPAGSSGLFAVLRQQDNVWVDTDQDKSFADETAMREYKRNFQVGWFGTDNPATPIREALPFVVQVADGQLGAGDKRFVNIGIVSGAHGSHVAGIATGNSLFGGAMSGGAPGAKIVSVRACLFIAGCTNHALLEGMIYAVKEGKVDVVNMSIGGLPALNDGNNTRCVTYNRLILKHDVQFFFSHGNSGPGVNTAGDPGACTDVMALGAYLSRASMQRNYGADTPFDDNLNYFTSLGPREDGGFKPQIVAPGSAVSTTPMWQAGGPVAGTYTLPPGYSMFNGTSMASPQATGGAALLLSAAKQVAQGKLHAAQLRQAINSSARHLDPSRFGAYAQGNGLMNVPAAWALIALGIEPVEITATVPVSTVLSGFLATPGVGRGIYDREGVTAGAAYTRTYTITRVGGRSGPRTFNLNWVGNDGTFSTPSSIALEKGVATSLPVGIDAAPGGHSAILNVDDPSTPGIDFQTMNTVIAPYEFDAGNNYSQSVSGSVGRGQQLHYFFRVPAGTPAFKVDLSTTASTTPGTGQIRFLRWHPFGVGVDSNGVSECYVPTQTICSTGNPLSRTVANPQAGVWEVTVDARRTSDADFTPFTLTGSILGATVSPNPDVIPTATIGVPVARSYTLTNLFGAFTGRAQGTNLGSARRGVFSIANHAQSQFVTAIPAGTTSFRATIGGASDPAADLDLFVFNCTTGPCVLAGQNADGDSEESVTINNPAAGNWLVLVDGFSVPAGTTTYNYIDVFFKTPSFGSISVTDANALRPAGSSWAVPGSVTALSAPAAGRVLFGNVEVRTDTNVLVGSGVVVVESVTP
jgi:subtilisin family serine protease